jgi:soluble lytic murein transglycosylase-like protein
MLKNKLKKIIIAGAISAGTMLSSNMPQSSASATKSNTLEEITAGIPKDLSMLSKKQSDTYNASQSKEYSRMQKRTEFLVDSIFSRMNINSHAVNAYLIKSSIREESGYNPRAEYISKETNTARSIGLMQLMESAWQEFGEGEFTKNAYDPVKNIKTGIKYYLWLEKYISKENPEWSNLDLKERQSQLLAAYNAGPTKLKNNNWSLEQMHYITRNHIDKVQNSIEELQQRDYAYR